MTTYRFPQMAIRCPWCHAPAGELCTDPRGRRQRRADTHNARRIAWAMTTQCAACHAPAGQPCTTEIRGHQVALPDTHPTRTPNPTTTP